MGYKNSKASDQNVRFSYDLALEAARDLHVMTGKVREHQVERNRGADLARPDWSGPKRVEFDEKMRLEAEGAAKVADGLVDTARTLAESWAKARGEQDRINHARWQDNDEQHRHEGENVVVEYGHKLGDGLAGVFGHGTDYGPAPEDPPVPQSPQFTPTRAPQHAEFEGAHA